MKLSLRCQSCQRSRSPRAGSAPPSPERRSSRPLRRGLNALKTFDPPLDSLTGREVASVGRRGKHLIVGFEGDLFLLVHLMSAGRLQLYDTRASLRDRTSRVLVRLADGRELRLREFGKRQRAWAKLLAGEDALEQDEAIATLGPEAWPDPPPLGRRARLLAAAALACSATSA